MSITLESQIKKFYFLGFLVIILFSIFSFSFAFISSVIYKNQSREFSQEILRLNLTLLDNKLLEIQDNQKIIVNDNKIREILKYRKENKKLDYSIELYNQRAVMERFNLLLSNLKIENAYIVNNDGKVYYTFKHNFINDEIKEEKWFRDIIATANLGISYVSEIHGNSYLSTNSEEKYISIVMPFSKFDSEPEEYLIYDISLSDILYNNIYGDITFVLLDRSGNSYLIEKNIISECEIKSLKKKFRGEKIVITSVKSALFGLEIFGIKNIKEIDKINIKILEIFGFIILLAGVLSKIISVKISEIITAPVKRLIKNCKIVSAGNYGVDFSQEENYEVNLLSQVIKNMIENIMFLNKKIVEEEKKISQEKLRTLQHQINPHFINNILQAIKGLAISGENEKISQISTLLGKIMAYSVYQPYDTVRIKDELEHVKNYVELQNIRFDGKIRLWLECEERLLETKIIKLTLQPLLENSIEHGVKSLGRGVITIGVEEEKDSICIIINDNGLGMEEEKLLEIQKNLRSGKVYDKERSIGIVNVNERLKKKYGRNFGVEITSKERIGTTVIVKLPKEN